LPESGVLLDGGRSSAWLWSRLTHHAAGPVSIPTVEAAAWSWPRVLRGALPGDSVMMAVRLDSADARAGTLNLVDVDASLRPLLERAVARAEVADLEGQLDRTPATAWDDHDAIKTRLLQASTAARVLCRLTGFVVLENDSAWLRTGVRVAPTKVLSLDSKGLHALHHVRGRADCCQVPRPGNRNWRIVTPADPYDGLFDDDAATIVTDDSLSVPMGIKDLARRERATDGERPGAVVATKVDSPPPPSEPAAVSDAVRASGLPELPQEPDDELGRSSPDLKPAGSPSQRWQSALPKVPAYRRSDYDKLPKPYAGRFGEIMDLLTRGRTDRARAEAEAWRQDEPGQTLALVALGEACRATGDVRRAARAFGSIIDLFPARADVRRFAAGRLASLHDEVALTLAIDSAWRAVDQRPDHPSGQHLLATFLLEAGQFEKALSVLTFALERNFDVRYPQALRLLREDAALAAEALAKADPSRAAEMKRRLARLHAPSEAEASLRFVLTWESDANDVDFHIRDGLGYHAFYARRTLPTGGELYADIRDGYGPECVTVREPAATRAYPYRLAIRYASRGPMGYGMGTVQVIEHDGHGKLWFEHRPFVIMSDGGYLELSDVQWSH
jgi:tetratricopeptide (TPR) repeat protein